MTSSCGVEKKKKKRRENEGGFYSKPRGTGKKVDPYPTDVSGENITKQKKVESNQQITERVGVLGGEGSTRGLNQKRENRGKIL